ncbi:MAG: hypothetical protein R3E79_49015 [Caldilineaceae bacterium]
MRYLVKARVKSGQAENLRQALANRTLGRGSVAGGEYLRNMAEARALDDDTVRWVEVCYCDIPLEEEQPYWEEYFELVDIKNAHARNRCKDLNGTEPWACSDCDCTVRLERTLATWGEPFLQKLSQIPHTTTEHEQ